MEETKEMDFQVIVDLPVVVFNVEELKSQALALVEKYDGLVFTEEEIPAVRRDMAMLNSLAEKLERARIDTAKQMMAPIKEFEAQIKDVSAILLNTRSVLGGKVQVFVEQQKELRRQAVLQAIEDVRTKYMAFCSGLQVQLRETWLAKSTSMISVKSDINDIFSEHTKAMEAQAALLIAKQERSQAIEAKAAGLEAQYGFALPRMQFASYLSMDFSLSDAYAYMEGVYQKEADRRAEAARIAAEKAEAARIERERLDAIEAERKRVAAEEQARKDAERARLAAEKAEEALERGRQEEARRAAEAEERARKDAEAARNRVDTPSNAEMAARLAETVTTSGQLADAQREALAPRKDVPQWSGGPQFNDPEQPQVVDDITTVTAAEVLKALVQEIKTAPHLIAVKNSKAFQDAKALLAAIKEV